MTRMIFVQFQFSAFHHWPDAPAEYAYLAHVHRHVFHVKAYRAVSHNNRDVEFIDFKETMLNHCRGICRGMSSIEVKTWSCEQWAEYLIKRFDLTMAEVSEDGENGAFLYR